MLLGYIIVIISIGFLFNIGLRLSNFCLGRLYVRLCRPRVKVDYEIKEKGDYQDE